MSLELNGPRIRGHDGSLMCGCPSMCDLSEAKYEINLSAGITRNDCSQNHENNNHNDHEQTKFSLQT